MTGTRSTMTLSRHAVFGTRAPFCVLVMFTVVLGLKTAMAQTEIDITAAGSIRCRSPSRPSWWAVAPRRQAPPSTA